MVFEILLLFIAGVVGGVLNSAAGGGSFITFPALLFVGVPPISANATNTFSSFSGYLSGAYAFRRELKGHGKALTVIIFTSLIGGAIGALLLMWASESVFQHAIPWLLLFATLLFVFGSKINTFAKSLSGQHKYASQFGAALLFLVLLCICVYGGFFNAGLGIIALSYLALAGYTNINTMNGIKLIVSSSVSLMAIILFIANDSIAWFEGSVVLVGTLIGGYLSARVSKQIPQHHMRQFVIVMSSLITVYFFYHTYFRF
ncbi:sulfite exporter TauE/SafE family protein [Shewanella intestini]|uniref:Probable membrane transporter protein n=1 Tax=Shewanella intestini TaxID=2017544 RepID=A0ABS5I6D8_9GAMM|nr:MULTISPECIES: sulfite exporter TauE/SafE family protein [Shewanella]MBR9728900.1 sulfite exporter TauE/SafE family protein [Shewanella intestini]MRG37034.1 TSUP family transporter [Shewanella sp. XMDDZSB0408]